MLNGEGTRAHPEEVSTIRQALAAEHFAAKTAVLRRQNTVEEERPFPIDLPETVAVVQEVPDARLVMDLPKAALARPAPLPLGGRDVDSTVRRVLRDPGYPCRVP